MKWKPYYTATAIPAMSGFAGLLVGDIVSYFRGILNPLGIILGIAGMLVWIGLYGYSRKCAWLRKRGA